VQKVQYSLCFFKKSRKDESHLNLSLLHLSMRRQRVKWHLRLLISRTQTCIFHDWSVVVRLARHKTAQWQIILSPYRGMGIRHHSKDIFLFVYTHNKTKQNFFLLSGHFSPPEQKYSSYHHSKI